MAGSSSRANVDHRRLIFRLGEQRHEIDSARVLEVARVSHITRVPHGPESLAGITNLRGKPIPVISMRKILDGGGVARERGGKIIVYDHGGAIGLLVDDVVRPSADASANPVPHLNDLLDTAFKLTRGDRVVPRAHLDRKMGMDAGVQSTAFLSFRVAGQLYGLPLDHIREVAKAAEDFAMTPASDTGVTGLISTGHSVLPLVTLASLLGLDDERSVGQRSRVIVVAHGDDLIGLVVDGLDVIHRLPHGAIDSVPAVLQRGRGDAQIAAIGRIPNGAGLIAILSPEKLFGHHSVTQLIEQNAGAKSMEAAPARDETSEQFLIFQLGEENYGLPIGSVDEVVRVQSEVTRVPGAPGFVMGVINLRGRAIPLIDQRSRFQSQTSPSGRARAIIVTLGSLQAGFVVDSVSEVKSVSVSALSTAPEFSSDRTGVFDRIAYIETEDRMILVIDPKELLTRAERDIVSAIGDEQPPAACR
ncbi:chemotaxis protein CheW [Neorhizobium sp. T786]|uniref:chemotaxis protein CheW n=1 Tax=Pseudorhizobium xiangyangii TaxID=2883104 RepID=UPI001CFFDDAD|nr:chemotaxis protein CheW [Neorhizobium xiangyangii]MCB5203811.1 chemotaxis protein CheW [Neorhizobium xiangyangii]